MFIIAEVLREQMRRRVLFGDLHDRQQSCLCEEIRMLYVQFRLQQVAEVFRREMRPRNRQQLRTLSAHQRTLG